MNGAWTKCRSVISIIEDRHQRTCWFASDGKSVGATPLARHSGTYLVSKPAHHSFTPEWTSSPIGTCAKPPAVRTAVRR